MVVLKLCTTIPGEYDDLLESIFKYLKLAALLNGNFRVGWLYLLVAGKSGLINHSQADAITIIQMVKEEG